jgi:hypothetical protein
MPENNLFCEYHEGDDLAADVIDDVVQVLNQALRGYDCQLSNYGRTCLLEELALLHVTFDPEAYDIDAEGQANG